MPASLPHSVTHWQMRPACWMSGRGRIRVHNEARMQNKEHTGMIQALRAPWPEIEPYAHGYLDTGEGHQIYWEQCGNPDGVPVVFLHGGPGGGCSPSQRRLFDPAR